MKNSEINNFRTTSTLRDIWAIFRKDKAALVSLYLFILLCLVAIFASLLAPYSNNTQFIGNELSPPAWIKEGQVAYFLGTDDIGRDLFSRIILGVRYTFGSALIIVLATVIVGGVLGIIIGVNKGIKARLLGYLLDIFLSIPILLVAIIIAALMEASLTNAMLAIFFALLPHFIHRIYRAIQAELQKDYVVLLRLEGIPNTILLKETILPNIATSLIQQIAKVFNFALMDISALSFISLGAPQTIPEWGAMIRESLNLLYIAPWVVILPGIAIMLSIFIVLSLANGITRAINKHYNR